MKDLKLSITLEGLDKASKPFKQLLQSSTKLQKGLGKTAGELKSRGYYLGSNVSYNLKKLVEKNFVEHKRSTEDKRSVRIRLTPKGQEVRETLDELFARQVARYRPVAARRG